MGTKSNAIASWVIVAWVAVSIVPHLAHAAPGSTSRPNFIFLLTDDQRWDALGVVQREQGEKARFAWFETPHLDRIAAEGVRFRNAFVTTSLCSPSRASFLTGQHAHRHGIRDNGRPFPDESVTWATLLRGAGYRTGYFGKWHMGKQSGHRPGFDVSKSFVGHSVYYDPAFEINGATAKQVKGWIDSISTDFALQFIEDNKTRPFAIAVGYKAPHSWYKDPPGLANLYADESAKPAVSANSPPAAGAASRKQLANIAKRPPARPREIRWYFRLLAAMDRDVGRILETLDRLGLSENTVVIFASDNGYYQGEHGLRGKQSAYEESIRIPLLMRYPRLVRPGTLDDDLVLNIDVAPTILDLAGITPPEQMQGRSLRPLLVGEKTAWRSSFYYQSFATGFAGNILALRTRDKKLIVYPNHNNDMELFDLTRDPYEMKNLANEPAQSKTLTKLRQEMQEQARLAEGLAESSPIGAIAK